MQLSLISQDFVGSVACCQYRGSLLVAEEQDPLEVAQEEGLMFDEH